MKLMKKKTEHNTKYREYICILVHECIVIPILIHVQNKKGQSPSQNENEPTKKMELSGEEVRKATGEKEKSDPTWNREEREREWNRKTATTNT